MKWHVGAVGMALLIVAASTTAASAAYDIFLRVDGIAGECAAAKHKGEMDVLSFSFGATNTGAMAYGSGGATGKAQVQDLHIVKRCDKASPSLFLAALSGKNINLVRLVCDDSGGDQATFLTVTLEGVLVSSITTSGNPAADATKPTEEVTFRFAKITWEYRARLPNGTLGASVTTGWDVKGNARIRTVGAAIGSGAPLQAGAILQPGAVLQAVPKANATKRGVILRRVVVPDM